MTTPWKRTLPQAIGVNATRRLAGDGGEDEKHHEADDELVLEGLGRRRLGKRGAAYDHGRGAPGSAGRHAEEIPSEVSGETPPEGVPLRTPSRCPRRP